MAATLVLNCATVKSSGATASARTACPLCRGRRCPPERSRCCAPCSCAASPRQTSEEARVSGIWRARRKLRLHGAEPIVGKRTARQLAGTPRRRDPHRAADERAADERRVLAIWAGGTARRAPGDRTALVAPDRRAGAPSAAWSRPATSRCTSTSAAAAARRTRPPCLLRRSAYPGQTAPVVGVVHHPRGRHPVSDLCALPCGVCGKPRLAPATKGDCQGRAGHDEAEACSKTWHGQVTSGARQRRSCWSSAGKRRGRLGRHRR